MQPDGLLNGPPRVPPHSVVARQVVLSIGGVVFRLSGRELPLLQETPWAVRPFLGPPAGALDGRVVEVSFELDPEPSFDGEVLFRSEAAWSLLARGKERGFVFRDHGAPSPLFAARFVPGGSEVVVRCSPAVVEVAGGERVLRSPFLYPFDQVLTMYALCGRGVLVHAAGLVRDGRGLAFPGVSGAGKSTFARLAAARPGWAPVSDDRVILAPQAEGGRCRLLGTPWPGEGQVAENVASPAGGLFFLEKGSANEVRPIAAAACLERLLPVVSVPWFDREHIEAGMSVLETVARSIPAAVLAFRPEEGAAEAVERHLDSRGEPVEP